MANKSVNRFYGWMLVLKQPHQNPQYNPSNEQNQILSNFAKRKNKQIHR